MSTLDSSNVRGARLFVSAVIWICLTTVTALAQTSTFTYQGRFTDGGNPANGTYDMQFKLFDGAGNQIGSTITNGAVTVTSGVFTVQLDYGAAAFPGADRLLEIGVRLAGSGEAYTVLSPRQPLTSTPYAIRAGATTTADTATNATQLGGVAANQYVLTNDARLTDARSPTAGSSAYIQNSINQQVATFNISGDGRAGTLSGNIVSADTQYNLGGARVLSNSGGSNLFAGVNAGAANTSSFNSFFGFSAGAANTGGGANSFFGSSAGAKNINGNNNSAFGYLAGFNNLFGGGNSFFGGSAGMENTNGSGNSYFGANAGASGTNGSNNSYFGEETGKALTDGDNNTFIGANAAVQLVNGSDNTVIGKDGALLLVSGSRNTALGSSADIANNLTNATAIGANARVDQSNSLVLGSIANVISGTANTNVGIGTSVPAFRLTVKTATSNYGIVHTDGTVTVGTYVGGSTGGGWLGTTSNHSLSFFVGGGGPSMTIDTDGIVHVNTLGAAGSTSLCLNVSNQISKCSSSLRYKTNVQPFLGGLALINRLRPISFDWKQGGMHDLGFGAEDVAAVEPLLVTRNDKGEVEGVKYDRISVALVNAVKEQQEQLRQQQSQITQQQHEIDELKRLVSVRHRRPNALKLQHRHRAEPSF